MSKSTINQRYDIEKAKEKKKREKIREKANKTFKVFFLSLYLSFIKTTTTEHSSNFHNGGQSTVDFL